jgi:hypothetical protein
MKTVVQAQHLQAGDIVGSGEVVRQVIVNSIQFPSNKVKVTLFKNNQRTVLWGKYTMINVERKAPFIEEAVNIPDEMWKD